MTVAIRALALEVEKDGFGACRGRSLPTFRVCVGDVDQVGGAFSDSS